MEELISVIIPVYNVENSLRKCVNSVTNQTYKNLQIILIDDGSTDLSSVICDELAKTDSRIEVIHQENGGLCKARNTGLSAAKGEYIGFIDSDDWITVDMYEYLYTGLKFYNADISACRYFRVIKGKETNARCDGETYVFNREQAIEEIICNFNLRTVFWNKLFVKKIFDNVKFPEGHTFEGTYMMHEVFEQADKIVMLGDPKYYYVKNPKSIIYGKNVSTDLQYALSNIKRYNDLIGDYPHLITKLAGDCAKNISRLSDHGKTITQKDFDDNREEFEQVSTFINDNIETLSMYYGNDKTKRKEFESLAVLTPSSYKKANKYKKKRNRSNKRNKAVNSYLKLFFGINLKKKSKNLLPPMPKKFNSNSYIKGVSIEGNDEIQKRLADLHACEMEIVKEIDRICKKNNITYYLYGGTLLGAVRHKGFIPWDDDVDLVMPRADYDKFAKACETELGSQFFYQTCFNDPNYPMLFAKVRKNNTRVSENKWSDLDMHQGCFVDILPLDHFPSDPVRSKLYLQIARILHQSCCFNKCKSSHLIAHIAFRYLKKKGPMYCYKKRDAFLRHVNRHGSKKYYCSFGSHYMPMIRRRLDSDWFGKPIDMEFEGVMLPAPGKWEGYILHLFGENYMELPPEEDRICHTDFERIITDVDKYKKWEAYRNKAVQARLKKEKING
ncbi:MAG: LicD family protein [Clostridiales bacterium]|nr:LicD family protein [Clostridiales bacterium]